MRHSLIGLIEAAAVLCASTALAQTARDVRGPAGVVPLASEPAPRIVIDVSPRIGHIHVTVDDTPWRWADASGEPLIINCLPPGPHRVLIELVDANHQPLDKGVNAFLIPDVVVPNCRR